MKRYRRQLKLGKIYDRMQELASDPIAFQDIDLITIDEMASYLNISTSTLRRWAKQGKITGQNVGNGKIYFSKSNLALNSFSGEKLLTCKEVATVMRVCPDTVAEWIREGKLAARKYGVKWLITKDDLQDFLEIGSVL